MVRHIRSAVSATSGLAAMAGLALAIGAAGPAAAHGVTPPPGAPYAHGDGPALPPPPPPPPASGAPMQPYAVSPGPAVGHAPMQEMQRQIPGREAWLAECRRRVSARDNGVGGAVIGGLVGGLAGNRIAGRGNRTVGTVAGAAVGAVAGMAIDKAEDRNRDECETYLDDYYASHGYGYGNGWSAGNLYGHAGYGYARADGCCQTAAMPSGPYMMVPVMMMPRGEPECTETVEYVEVPSTPARRAIPPRARPQTKRVPDKRVRVK